MTTSIGFKDVPRSRELTIESEGSSMPLDHPERRRLARLPLEVLVQIRVPAKGLVAFAETRNVSAQGLYVHTHAEQLEPGEDVECILVLPENLTQADEPMLVECRGKVVRVNRDLPKRLTGVAIEVHSFDFAWRGALLPDTPQ